MTICVAIPAGEKEAGFSLTEVLVSVFIFAVVGTISVGLMSTSLSAQEHNADVLEQTSMIDLTRTLLREDLGQLTTRPSRDTDGRTNNWVFAGDSDGLDVGLDARDRNSRTILSFTRRGRANPGLLRPRSSLARVEYAVRDGDLVRRLLPYPDGSADGAAAEIVLASAVDDVELEFLVGAAWSRRIGLRSGNAEGALPRAVRLRYSAARLGAMEHIVLTTEAGQ